MKITKAVAFIYLIIGKKNSCITFSFCDDAFWYSEWKACQMETWNPGRRGRQGKQSGKDMSVVLISWCSLSSVTDRHHLIESRCQKSSRWREGRERYFILEAWSRIILLLDDMIKNLVAMLHLSYLPNFEIGYDTTYFFSRSDDGIKLWEELAFRICRIENWKGCFAREKMSEFIEEIQERNSVSSADNG